MEQDMRIRKLQKGEKVTLTRTEMTVTPTPEREELLDRVYDEMSALMLTFAARYGQLPAHDLAIEAADYQRRKLAANVDLTTDEIPDLEQMGQEVVEYLTAHGQLILTISATDRLEPPLAQLPTTSTTAA